MLNVERATLRAAPYLNLPVTAAQSSRHIGNGYWSRKRMQHSEAEMQDATQPQEEPQTQTQRPVRVRTTFIRLQRMARETAASDA